ncbi:MAG TPA: HIT family protein [Candidatus Binataceae bacterium]|nr:HIT family protein [Candidatus Binataceae bacterium]
MASDAIHPRPCGICRLIERATARFDDFIAELPRSWLILGDAQFYRGYTVLLAKRPVNEIHLMPRGEAHELLDELIAVGKALSAVVQPHKLNYECLGNQEPHVHWHIFPRSLEDPMRLAPVWLRPESERKLVLPDDDRRALIVSLRSELARLIPAGRYS